MDFEFIKMSDFIEIEGKFEGFVHNQNGVSVLIGKEEGVFGLGLNTVLKSLFKTVLESGGIELKDEIKILKGKKEKGKKYFESKLFINGAEIINTAKEIGLNEAIKFL